jgi:hypothetical protein
VLRFIHPVAMGTLPRMKPITRRNDPECSARAVASRGDGSALSSFLCPVCQADVLVDGVACSHLLLVHDRHGEIYCRSSALHGLVASAEQAAGRRGRAALESLCGRLGPGVRVYELAGSPSGAGRFEPAWFLVDENGPVRAAA